MQASVRKQAFLHSRKYLLAHGRVGETPFPSIKPDGVADMATVGYVCIGTNDFDRATAFYDALLGEFGGKRMMPTPKGLIYQLGDGAMLLITRPYDENPATVGTGNMVEFQADNQEQVAQRTEARRGGKGGGSPGG